MVRALRIGTFTWFLVLLAACGDSASGPASTAVAPTGSAGVVVAETSAPTSSGAGAAVTSEPDIPGTIVPSSPAAGSALPVVLSDISGEWTVLREVTTDGGLFGSDQYAELRQWDITCVDAGCEDITIASSIQGQEPSADEPATFDGDHLSHVSELTSPCFVVADNDFTGPPLLTYTQVSLLDVTETDADGYPTVMRGTYTYDEVLDPAAAESDCATDLRSAEMDTLIFRTGRVRAIAPAETAGVARGGANVISVTGTALPGAAPRVREVGSQEYPISPSSAKQFGDYEVEIPAGGSGKFTSMDLPLSGDDPADGYVATSSFTDDCVSAIDGGLIAADAFAVSISVELRVFDAGEAVVMMQVVREVVPTAKALAVDFSNCFAYKETTVFGGRVVPDPLYFTADGEPL